MTISKAIENNDLEYVKNHLGIFNPNELGEFEFPLFHRACYLGHLEMMKLLLDNGANIDILDEYNDTPLSSIICGNESNWYDCIEFLIKNGASLQDDILINAIREEVFIDVIKLLIEHGAKIDYIDENGDKAINYAYDRNLQNIIELLELNGAKYDGKMTQEEQILRDSCFGTNLKKKNLE